MNSAFRQSLSLVLPCCLILAGCDRLDRLESPGSPISLRTPSADGRGNGRIYTPMPRAPGVSYGAARRGGSAAAAAQGAPAYSLDFADTDVREAAGQVLGSILGLNYSIDPAVKGTVTLHTPRPLTTAELLPTLQGVLSGVGAVLVRTDGLYRVVPAGSAGAAGSVVVPLRFVSAEELARVLQPIAGTNARITADPALNSVLISGEPLQAQSLSELVRSFDIDALAGQSYAILPIGGGNAKDIAEAMTGALRGKGGGGLSGLVRVVPLPRMNAVLVVSSQARYIEAAQRVFALIERERRFSVRAWHVYYLQNSNANDIAHTLQMAFTPNNVSAQPQMAAQGGSARRGGGFGGGQGGGGQGGGGLGGGRPGAGGGGLGGGPGGASGGISPLAPAAGLPGDGGQGGGGQGGGGQGGGNPLLGGVDQAAQESGADTMRILPNPQNNAILVYGTAQEEETVTAMLRKIDIMSMQVRIDATIAEVTLNDELQYGTQFFFKSKGINGILNNAPGLLTTAANTALGATFPGLVLGGNGPGGAPFAISALQAVTTVRVLSSPQLTVVDNQPARLQVGALVPYLTGNSQSTLSANAPVINSIAYQPTGVIMEVTPRVNSGGLVTLDLNQEVSDVDTTVTTSGINSPTFQQRSITSRVVVQDGETIGLAGLIRDTSSRGNQGIPWLKDIPILGVLAGTQSNTRARTELLVLITPHIIRDQTDARAMTEEMRAALGRAAAVPAVLGAQRPSGYSDPNRRIREGLQNIVDPRPRR